MERTFKSPKAVERRLKMVNPEIRRGLMFGVYVGELCLVWKKENLKLHHLKLIVNWLGRSVDFTDAISASEITVKSLTPENPSGHPRPLIINSPTITLGDIARNFYSYLHDFYPQVEHLPIGIFMSEKDFIKGKKTATVKHDEILLHAA